MPHTRKCPYCTEEIEASALKCSYCGESFDSPPQEGGDEPGIIPDVGDYRVIEQIGRGGMGMVYRARHRDPAAAAQDGGDVCIKKMHAQLTREADYCDRFQREAALGESLNHDGIVKVLSHLDDELALIMELVKGRSLARHIGRETGPIPWHRAWPLFQQLLAAVGYAHEHGVIHRDLKPDNVMLTKGDKIKVLDFGLAKGFGPGATRTGTGLGTAHYMAPEQHHDAKNVDRRADIYALGMTLYVMLAGRLPWGRKVNLLDLLLQKRNAEIPLPTKFYPDIPVPVVNVVMAALASDRELRPDSVEVLRDMLEEADAAQQRGDVVPLRVSASAVAGEASGGVAAASEDVSARQTPDEGELERPTAVEPLEMPTAVEPLEMPTAAEPLERPTAVEPLERPTIAEFEGGPGAEKVPVVASAEKDAAPTLHEPIPREAVEAMLAEEEALAQEREAPSTSTPRFSRGALLLLAGVVVGVLLALLVYLVVRGPESADDPDSSDEEETAEAVSGPKPNTAEVKGAKPLQWVSIPGGAFDMRSPQSGQPVHRVTIQTYSMARTETTVGQYWACVQVGRCTKPRFDRSGCNWTGSGANQPINCVDWMQAKTFCEWKGGRLPSESEWAYAASSGGNPWRYPWGKQKAMCTMAVMDSCYGKGTRPVCTRKVTARTKQELCDMAGNLQEYVEDCWHDDLSDTPDDGSAWTSPICGARTARGGSFGDDAHALEIRNRFNIGKVGNEAQWVGFRCAKDGGKQIPAPGPTPRSRPAEHPEGNPQHDPVNHDYEED